MEDEINQTLENVKLDYYRFRNDQPTKNIHIINGETLELSRIYFTLNNDENKKQLGNHWKPLWQKFELVKKMWNKGEDWDRFEKEWSRLEGELAL